MCVASPGILDPAVSVKEIVTSSGFSTIIAPTLSCSEILHCQKRPTTGNKETYYSVKRDLLTCSGLLARRGFRAYNSATCIYDKKKTYKNKMLSCSVLLRDKGSGRIARPPIYREHIL